MQPNFNDLLQREMSRKEFLRTVGIGLASVFGLSLMARLAGAGHKTLSHGQTNGYGTNPYGK